MSTDVPPPLRVPLLVLGFASLVVGVAAGLARLGWDVPLPSAGAALHGPLMVSGFFGTVIALERAVALARRWAYLAPLLSGLSGFAAISSAQPGVPPALSLAGSVMLLIASLAVFRLQRALFTFTLALGALCWCIGNGLWLSGLPLHQVVPWWAGFFVLTIAGERLELSRFLRPSPIGVRLFALLLALLSAAIVSSLPLPGFGTVLLGLGFIGLAAWLLRYDIARRTVKSRALTRYIAVCLLSGYAWLAIAGSILVAGGGLGAAGTGYDAALHALLLGFVFSMVFGHAAIIFPAVGRVTIPYHPVFYLPLVLLHASLLLRMAGDAAGRFEWRNLGGAGNALALVAFVLVILSAIVRGQRQLTARRSA